MIHAENLSKYYSGQMAIENINFTIEAGEVVGLLGLNGAGKSTILKILGCFLLPSKGRATIDGISVEEKPEVIRTKIGFLPDTPPLYDEMTVERYLNFVARLKDVPSSAVEESVIKALAKTNLESVAHDSIATLSHGFRQRVGIAQAIVHNPSVLILDEPINGLDPVQIVEMRDLITSLRKQHTVILSSHILSEITRTCDRILIVDRGQMVAEGKEADLQKQLSTGFHLTCTLDRADPSLVDKIKKISGINHAVIRSMHAGEVILDIDFLGSDLRPEIARVIVNSGAGLLSMNNQDVGLENLFLKFVKGASSQEGLSTTSFN